MEDTGHEVRIQTQKTKLARKKQKSVSIVYFEQQNYEPVSFI